MGHLIDLRFFCFSGVGFPCVFGGVLIKMSMASSKVKGWSEIGFAFGMVPPWADQAAYSLDHTSCWHASPLACSAFCYHIIEDVRILAVIVAIAELREIQRQIVFAHLVEGADHATLQQAPEAIQVCGMDIPAHIFTFTVIDGLVRELAMQSGIARMFVSGHQRDLLTDRIPHEVAQGQTVCILNDLADYVTLASNRTNNTDLSFPAFYIVPFCNMAVSILSADVRLVYLNFAHQFAKASILHSGSNAMARIPGGSIGSTADDALDLQGADTLLAGQHQKNDLKPRLQGVVRVLKDGFCNHREAVAIASTAFLALTDPVKWAALYRKHLGIVAAWAGYAIGPAALLKKRLAGFFGLESLHHAAECLGFHMASVMLRPFYRVSTVVSSKA